MRKITLDLDTLQVASFEAGPVMVQRGTVDAKAAECPYTYCAGCTYICTGYETCGVAHAGLA